jgi:triosephosphate isomerase (TIM)
MRKPIIAGNWKMNKTISEAVELARAVRRATADINDVDIVLCPPFTALSAVKEVLGNSKIGLGAQNMHWAAEGAYTGEVSPKMVAELCQYVIIGHSERRQYFAETDETVNNKVKAAFANGLIPIVCLGEGLSVYEAGQTNSYIGNQVRASLAGVSAADVTKLLFAYEPVWAIGTGKAAEPPAVNSIIGLSIRGVLAELYGEAVAQAVRVQYGGSVKPDNVRQYMAQTNIDGGLIGGAALKPDSFVALIEGARS